MKKNRVITTLLCGIISMSATIVYYLLTFDSIFTIPMRWLSLLCLILTQIIGIVKLTRVRISIFGVAQITAWVVHLLAVLVISVIFVNLFPLLLKQYILLNLLILSAIALIDIVLMYFDHVVNQTDHITQTKENKYEK